MIENMLIDSTELTLPVPMPSRQEHSFKYSMGRIESCRSVRREKPYFLLAETTPKGQCDVIEELSRLSYENDLLQLEMKRLHEIPRVLKAEQIVATEEKYYKHTYNESISSEAKVMLNHVVKKLAKIEFKKLNLEFTLLNTAIFRLELKNNITLLVTIPLAKHENLDAMEVVYNLFVEGEEIVSNNRNLNEVLEGAKELIGQSVEFTTA